MFAILSSSRPRICLPPFRRHITTDLLVKEVNASISVEEQTYIDFFRRKEPLLLKNVASNWPAVNSATNSWKDMGQMQQRFSKKENDPYVRVEVGESYMDPNVKVYEIPFSLFLAQISDQTCNISHQSMGESNQLRNRVYLAQQCIKEIPILKEDIYVPDICLCTGYKSIYKTNLWFGGRTGSKSPCHYDPYDNVLVQVVGEKEVILFSPSQSDLLYPALGTLQKNTSLVNILSPNFQIHPDSKLLKGYRITLREGDGLYIPKKWWHFVHTNNTSVSVNFWWV